MPAVAPRLLLLLALGVLACRGAPEARSLVLVTLDTTRVDHLSCYGYPRITTPHLDAFAERAVRYRRAWSTSSWTLPAHASLFTGLYPARHGAHFRPEGDAQLGEVVHLPIARYVRAGKLGDDATTLAELLAARGYATGAFVGGPWLHRSFGLLQGFQTRDDAVRGFGGRPAEAITDGALAWLDGIPSETPYFLFANYFDPHAPYEPRESYPDLPRASEPFEPDYDALMRGTRQLDADQRAILRDRYDAEIRGMDRQLGRLLDAVLSRPGGDRTLVVVTADHGEALGNHGRFGHGFWLSEGLVRIPLLVRHPGDRDGGTRSDVPIQLVDVLPLVARELGFAAPDDIEGVAPGGRRDIYAELYRDQTAALRFGRGYDRRLDVAIEWPWKLRRSDPGAVTLYRLSSDDLEETAVEDPDVRARLLGALAAHVAARPPAEGVTPEVDPHTVEALRRLGYVD